MGWGGGGHDQNLGRPPSALFVSQGDKLIGNLFKEAHYLNFLKPKTKALREFVSGFPSPSSGQSSCRGTWSAGPIRACSGRIWTRMGLVRKPQLLVVGLVSRGQAWGGQGLSEREWRDWNVCLQHWVVGLTRIVQLCF